MYTIFFFLSIAVWLVSAMLTVCMRLRKKTFNLSNEIGLFSIGSFLSLLMLHIPVNNEIFGHNPVKTVLASAYNALQTFTLNGSFDQYETMPKDIAGWLQTAYPVWTSAMYVLAPILAFGFALSFFKNLSAYTGYVLGYSKDAYIFSALNERSVILAESIRKEYPTALLVFANTQNSGDFSGFSGRCAAMNALRFHKNIREVNFKHHGKNAALCFFLVDDDENVNEQDAPALLPASEGKTNVRVYLFSGRVESEMLLQSLYGKCAGMKLFRIDETQSLVFNYLYENSIFETAVKTNGGKVISVVIIGLDQIGSELLKAVSWCGQMNGYTLMINAFDESPHAESRLRAECPELVKRSGIKEKGEAYYEITIHSGIDYGSSEFPEAVCGIGPVTQVFVTTGNDEQNIDISMNVHIALERKNRDLPPSPICAYVRNPHKAALLRENRLYYKNRDKDKKNEFNISVFGDLETCYSWSRVMYSELEQTALERHKKWGDEKDFYTSGYNYRSSIAWVIRKKWRDVCGIAMSERTELEHKGWNAYMRSVGYSYGPARNDRAKLHHDLVCFDDLSEEDKRKDEADL